MTARRSISPELIQAQNQENPFESPKLINRKSRISHVSPRELGVRGRKTGITLKKTAKIDIFGFPDVEDIFDDEEPREEPRDAREEEEIRNLRLWYLEHQNRDPPNSHLNLLEDETDSPNPLTSTPQGKESVYLDDSNGEGSSEVEDSRAAYRKALDQDDLHNDYINVDSVHLSVEPVEDLDVHSIDNDEPMRSVTPRKRILDTTDMDSDEGLNNDNLARKNLGITSPGGQSMSIDAGEVPSVVEIPSVTEEVDEQAVPAKKRKKQATKKKAAAGDRFAREDTPEDGARRSRRTRVAPVEFWRNERVTYKFAKEGEVFVPVVKDVIKPQKIEVSTSKGNRITKEDKRLRQAGFQPSVPEAAIVRDAEGNEIEDVIMFTEKMLQMVPTTDGFSFCRTFEGENFKVGVMEIPANATKPNKPAGSRTIVAFVVSGVIQVTVHKTTFAVRTGAQFLVPPYNQYRIVNIGSNPARILILQLKL